LPTGWVRPRSGRNPGTGRAGGRPAGIATDRLFVVLKGSRRAQPLLPDGLDEALDGARRRAGLAHATCHELRRTCLTRLREAGMALEAVQAGHASIEATRIYLHLADDWLASQYRKAAEVLDAQLLADTPTSVRAVTGPLLLLPTWEQPTAKPQPVDTMRRYLQEVACVLRPGSMAAPTLHCGRSPWG
jgi:hypothetical protein